MKVKKLLAGLLSAAMVLGTMAFPVFAEDGGSDKYVAKIGGQSYATISKAVEYIQENPELDNEITILSDISLDDLAPVSSLRSVTLIGTGTQTIDFADKTQAIGAEITFKNLIINEDNGNYNGIQHCPKQLFDNCVINGQYWSYAQDTEFKGCTFNQTSSDAYNIWTYAANDIRFKQCTFNSAGKSVLIYDENSKHVQNSTFDGCTFIASAPVAGKAAIEIDSSLVSRYSVKINNCTANGFDNGTVSGNKLWNNKKGNNTTVTVDDEQIFPITVAKIGENKYYELADAMNDLAANGGTLEFLQEIDGSNYTTPVRMTKDAVIKSNGYSITDLKMPLVETTGDIKLIFNDVKIDKADILVKNGAYANGLGIAAFVCYKNLGTSDIKFNNCEITNSKIIADEHDENIRSAGFIGYYDGGKVTVNGGKVENTTIEAVNGVGAITAFTDKPLTVNGTVIKNNTITSKENRIGKTIIAGSVIGTATVSAMSIKATVSGNETTQNIGGTQTPVTTIYGRVINGAELTLEADSSFDKVPFNDGDAVKLPNGYALDPKDNTVKTLNAVLENNKELTDTEITDIIEDVKVENADQAAEIVKTIKAIDKDVQKEITPEKVEEIINAQDKNTALDATTTSAAFSMDSTISATVEEKADTTGVNVVLTSGANNKVYDVKAFENTVEKNETSTPVLVKIKTTETITKVLHDHNGTVKEIPFTQANGYVMFTMNEFSNVALVPAVTVSTEQAKLSFVPHTSQPEGKAVYDVVLTGDNFDTVKNFVSGDFVTTLTGTGSKPFEYVIEPINNEIVVERIENSDGTRKYHVNLNHFDVNTSYTITEDTTHAKSVVIGTMTVEGYGAGSIVVSNIQMNKHDATAENLAKEITTIAGEPAIFDIAVPTRNLTVNVTFPNTVKNNAKTYQKMWVTISGGDLSAPITKELGNDVQGVSWNGNGYTLTNALTLDKTYTVTVSGEGYRTARYNVTMTDNKTLNFWNNVKNVAEAVEVENGVGKDESKKNVTFLAGEIVKDNNINIYDLSAVVSYFGTNNNVNTSSAYAKYDLNRDGMIDSKDVAYVLVSWGK